MKTLFLAFTLLIPLTQAAAKCNTKAVGYYNQTGFGISFGGGSSSAGYYDKNTVNVPLTINGEQACFKKVSEFSMKSEQKKDKSDDTSIVITPMKAEYENIPSPHLKQYLFVEKNPVKRLTKFHVMSFICAGEIPVSLEATSDSVYKIEQQTNSANVEVNRVFATGAAAENLRRHTPSTNETFEFFTKLYKDKTNKELSGDVPCCTDYNAPSIISSTSVKALSGVERAIASSFTTMAENVPNGCSNAFADSMKKYQLENYAENDSLKDIKVKKKGWFSNDLLFEW